MVRILGERPHLFVPKIKRTFFLPEGYKNRKHRKTEGRASTGEVSPKGLVSHVEDWDGRVAAEVAKSTIRYIRDGSTFRPMTFKEMVERGYFVLGKGPEGFDEQD